MNLAIELCIVLERVLRPHGLHVALTGSMLYGMGTGKDLDVVVYAHSEQEKGLGASSLFSAAAFVVEPIVAGLKPLRDPKYSGRIVWSGQYQGMRVDLLVLTEAPHE